MRFRRAISALVLAVIVLSAIVAGLSLILGGGPGRHEFTSVFGRTVTIDGRGIYQNDSLSAAAQARGQDVVTLVIGLPLLVIALVLARRGSLKGRLLLAGTLGYFLYTYTSLLFLAVYNRLFLVYVAVFSAALAAFILSMMSLDAHALAARIDNRLPVRLIGWFQILISFSLLMMWLGRIVPPLLTGGIPTGLDHYSTLVIQGLDIGIIVPLGIVSGVLLLRRDAYGYLLSSVMAIKSVTMLTAISAMIVGQLRVGDSVPAVMIAIFGAANLIAIYCVIAIMRSVSERRNTLREAVS